MCLPPRVHGASVRIGGKERERSGARMVREGVLVLIRSSGRGGGSRVEELRRRRGIPVAAEVGRGEKGGRGRALG